MRVKLGIAVTMLAGAAACGGTTGTTGTTGQPQQGGAVATSATAQPAASAATAADTVALGTVLDNGAPKAGVPVYVVAWPNSAIIDKQKEGDEVETVVVAQGKTDASGHFSLGLDPAKLDPKYVDDDGSVALEIVLENEAGPSTEFTALRGDKGWVTSDGDKPFEADLEATADGEIKVKRLDVQG